MKEDFLHYIWKFKKLNINELASEEGEPIRIIRSGRHNHDSGPDFLDARIKIGDTEWAGHVEIHIRASDWKKHGHQKDKAYNNVILHVVYHADEKVFVEDGRPLPVLELRKHIKRAAIRQYEALLNNPESVPCSSLLSDLPGHVLYPWIDRLLIERLERKTEAIADLKRIHKGSWDDALYILLARYFGLKVNDQAFEWLARSTPLKLLKKHRSNLFQLEALLFGQAGMLAGSFEEEYPQSLQKEYLYFQKKYSLKEGNAHYWKFMRMRPANFPTIRIAQLAALIHKNEYLHSAVTEAGNYKELKAVFNITPSEYWHSHYRFDKRSPGRGKKTGKIVSDHLLINVAIPYRFFYGKEQGHENLSRSSLEILEEMAPENNKIIREWIKILPVPKLESAYQSQALLTLKKQYCEQKRCLNCAIGHYVLNRNRFEAKNSGIL